jgi:hypothetical protein
MKHRQILQTLAVISTALFCSTQLGAQVQKAGNNVGFAKDIVIEMFVPTRGLLPGGSTDKELRMRALAVRDGTAGHESADPFSWLAVKVSIAQISPEPRDIII